MNHGAAVVTIYRQRKGDTNSGWQYVWSWQKPGGGRGRDSNADWEKAVSGANLKAQQLAKNIHEGEHVDRGDIEELVQARALAKQIGMPLLAALEEFLLCRQAAGGNVLTACKAFKADHKPDVRRVKLAAAIDGFIAEKERAGKRGERTYRSKLKPMLTVCTSLDPKTPIIGDVFADTVTTPQWTSYLETFPNGVTRNDHRKRAHSLFLWLERQGYLKADAKLTIANTDRAGEMPTDIGILEPAEYARLLEWIREKHPAYLAALVLAGFLGVRSDEIHGKMPKKGTPRSTVNRQKWSDIHLDERKVMRVTAAKTNTPANRNIPLGDAAFAWLQLTPEEQRVGYVCTAGAMENIRWLAIEEGFNLPENCFRHSSITYQCELTGNKAQVATWSGNSVAEIDRRYRVPVLKSAAVAYYAIRPKAAA